MSLYCFLFHALCQAIIWALISTESHETWKGRPGKRFYEAVKMEFVIQLQFTEHRGKKASQKWTSIPKLTSLSSTPYSQAWLSLKFRGKLLGAPRDYIWVLSL